MRVLDLFAGIGGFSLGLERAGMQTLGFCEIEPFCRKILKKHWPTVPIFEDITTLSGDEIDEKCGTIDLVCGGFPCQPYSVAGKRGGEADDRALWPEMFRVVKEVGPRWVVGENVPGFVSLGLDGAISDLENIGYTVETLDVPACAVDAPHRRSRLWIVAHSESQRREEKMESGSRPPKRPASAGCPSVVVADASVSRRHEPMGAGETILEEGTLKRFAGRGSGLQSHPDTSGTGCKKRDFPAEPEKAMFTSGLSHAMQRRRGAEPGLGGGPDGLPSGMDELDGYREKWRNGEWETGIPRTKKGVKNRNARLKALGNAVVPQVVYEIGRMILAADVCER